MKRIIIAGLLAVGFHGLLLKMEVGWLQRDAFEKPTQRPISITLAIKQPQISIKKKENKPSIVPEKPSLNKPAPLKKKTTLHVPKPELKKRIKPSVQPVDRHPPTPTLKTVSDPVQEWEANKSRYTPQAATTNESPAPEDQAVIEARPLYRINPPPKYPAMARRRGYAGQVVLDVLVGQSGSVIELRVSTSSGYGVLDDAAVAAVKTWMFEPGVRGNKAVDMWVRIPIRFELK